MRNILIYFAIKYKGNYFKILEALKNKEKISSQDIETIKSKKVKAITCIDKEYPSYFKQSFYSPLVLFYEGDISLLNYPMRLGVIGSRDNSEYGAKATVSLLTQLFEKKEVLIVSGLAKGIDSIAHETALNCHQKTIAVLGSGIKNCYPKSNLHLYNLIKEQGLILSEYPFDVEPDSNNFPMRNRIISAISQKILVTDAKIKSGTQITVKYALEEGKDVFAVPHSIFDESFCNVLISQGAKPIFTGNDLIEEFL